MLQSRYFEVVLLIIWNNCVVWGLAEGEKVEVSIGYATLGDGVLTGATTDGDESAW
jgi:hypothetical protein